MTISDERLAEFIEQYSESTADHELRSMLEELRERLIRLSWIPVSERMPEKDSLVMAYVPKRWRDQGYPPQNIFIGYINDNGDEVAVGYYDGYLGEEGPVTHWANLPEPPE